MTLGSSGDPNSRYQVELKPPSQENGLNFDMKLQLFHALAPLFNTLLKMKKTVKFNHYHFHRVIQILGQDASDPG